MSLHVFHSTAFYPLRGDPPRKKELARVLTSFFNSLSSPLSLHR